IYLTDIHLQSNKFANFFDYVRRTGSSVILPALVRDELVHTQRQKFTACVTKVEKELKELHRYAINEIKFHAPHMRDETNDLKALFRKPSKGVRTKFVDNMDDVDIREVVRRGINRVLLVSELGEELRDVILWLTTLN